MKLQIPSILNNDKIYCALLKQNDGTFKAINPQEATQSEKLQLIYQAVIYAIQNHANNLIAYKSTEEDLIKYKNIRILSQVDDISSEDETTHQALKDLHSLLNNYGKPSDATYIFDTYSQYFPKPDNPGKKPLMYNESQLVH